MHSGVNAACSLDGGEYNESAVTPTSQMSTCVVHPLRAKGIKK